MIKIEILWKSAKKKRSVGVLQKGGECERMVRYFGLETMFLVIAAVKVRIVLCQN
jgi:hypothetical protein